MPRTATEITHAEALLLEQGAHALGGVPGLMMRVRESGVRTIVLDYRNSAGKIRRYNLGAFPALKLAKARRDARKILVAVGDGADPAEERRAKRRPVAPVVEDNLAEALDEWMADAANRLRPGTMRTYGTAVARFAAWSEGKLTRCDELNRAHLAAFRSHLVALPKQAGVTGGRRGRKRPTGEKRSALAVNGELRTIKTILNALRRAGRLPGLDRDAITDNLASLPVPREQPTYLKHKAIGKLLAACERYDGEVFAATREEHAAGSGGTTARFPSIKPFALFLLLTGCRRGEALGLTWDDVDLDAKDNAGKVVGEIHLGAAKTKTHSARTVHLDVSPMLREMLVEMEAASAGERVFDQHTPGTTDQARRRLQEDYGAPTFTWKDLRATCGTYLTNASGIFGAATVYLSARQLGHSVQVAERHYLGVIRGIPADATSLEAAMRIS